MDTSIPVQQIYKVEDLLSRYSVPTYDGTSIIEPMSDMKKQLCHEHLDNNNITSYIRGIINIIKLNSINDFTYFYEKYEFDETNNKSFILLAAFFYKVEIFDYLLPKIADLCFDDGLLICASVINRHRPDNTILERLLDHGLDIKSHNDFALNISVRHDKIETVKFVMTYYDDIPDSAVIIAANDRDFDILELFISTRDIDINMYNGLLIDEAIWEGDDEFIEFLIELGFNVNEMHISHKIWAIRSGYPKIMDLLLSHGMELTLPNTKIPTKISDVFENIPDSVCDYKKLAMYLLSEIE